MSISAKSKTFEFWSISLWERIIVFIVFIILFHLPMFYTSELQKFWGLVIRLYFPILVLCTFGYVKLRSRKLIIEVNNKNQREFIYTRNNKQLLTEFEKVKIFYLKSLKGKIGLASYTLLVCGQCPCLLMPIFRKLFLIDYKRKLSIEDPHQLTRDVKYESRRDRLGEGRLDGWGQMSRTSRKGQTRQRDY